MKSLQQSSFFPPLSMKTEQLAYNVKSITAIYFSLQSKRQFTEWVRSFTCQNLKLFWSNQLDKQAHLQSGREKGDACRAFQTQPPPYRNAWTRTQQPSRTAVPGWTGSCKHNKNFKKGSVLVRNLTRTHQPLGTAVPHRTEEDSLFLHNLHSKYICL